MNKLIERLNNGYKLHMIIGHGGLGYKPRLNIFGNGIYAEIMGNEVPEVYIKFLLQMKDHNIPEGLKDQYVEDLDYAKDFYGKEFDEIEEEYNKEKKRSEKLESSLESTIDLGNKVLPILKGVSEGKISDKQAEQIITETEGKLNSHKSKKSIPKEEESEEEESEEVDYDKLLAIVKTAKRVYKKNPSSALKQNLRNAYKSFINSMATLEDSQKDRDILLKSLNKLYEKVDYFYIDEKTNKLATRKTDKGGKEDDLYIELTKQREGIEPIDEEEWEDILENDSELEEIYESLTLEQLEDNYEELQDYKKPSLLKCVGKEGCHDFEDKFATPEATKLFLSNIIEGFNSKTEITKVIHTEYDIPDPYFPVDVIVETKTPKGEIKKYAIELKYYDKTLFYGVPNKKRELNKTGSETTYGELIELQKKLYDKYKRTTIADFDTLNKELSFELRRNNINKINELKSKVKELEKLLSNPDEFNKSFNKNTYGYNIGMKFTKGGYNFEVPDPADFGYNTKESYEHLSKLKTHQQKVIKFNATTGRTDGIQSMSTTGKPLKYSDLLKDCELLYCISMRDAVIGMNYSDHIRKGKAKIGNPFYNAHLVKSSYGSYTDSFGLKLEDFILIKKIKK